MPDPRGPYSFGPAAPPRWTARTVPAAPPERPAEGPPPCPYWLPTRKQIRERRARAAVLWGLATFALFSVVWFLAVMFGPPRLRDPYYGDKFARLQERIDPADRPLTVVMLGSSRTTYGLRGGLIEGELSESLGRPTVVFNFGLYGAGPFTNLLNLHRLLRDGVRPDLLLVEVLPPLLAGQVPLHEVAAARIPTASLWPDDIPLVERYGGPARAGMRRDWWKASVAGLYYNRFAIVSNTFPHLLHFADRRNGFADVDPSGWLSLHPNTLTPEGRKRGLEIMCRDCQHYLKDFRLGGLAPEAVRELLETCRHEGIPVALVLMPEGPIFRSLYTADAWNQVEAFLDGLRREYDVPIINAREWIAEEQFADSHHLSPTGGAQFTKRLGREALLPLLRQISAP